MSVSKAQQAATRKYKAANYDRMELLVPKGKKELIKAAAADAGQSVNQYVFQAVSERMQRDNATPPRGDGGDVCEPGEVSD